MKRAVILTLVFFLALSLSACAENRETEASPEPAAQEASTTLPPLAPESGPTQAQESKKTEQLEEEDESIMQMKINDTLVTVAWEENESVDALLALAEAEPLTIQMSMYGGFEQVGPIGQRLPRNDVQTTTDAGDIVLYSGNQIVVFYGSNSWAYTRLGHITDKTADEMTALLGKGDVTITIGKGL